MPAPQTTWTREDALRRTAELLDAVLEGEAHRVRMSDGREIELRLVTSDDDAHRARRFLASGGTGPDVDPTDP